MTSFVEKIIIFKKDTILKGKGLRKGHQVSKWPDVLFLILADASGHALSNDISFSNDPLGHCRDKEDFYRQIRDYLKNYMIHIS